MLSRLKRRSASTSTSERPRSSAGSRPNSPLLFPTDHLRSASSSNHLISSTLDDEFDFGHDHDDHDSRQSSPVKSLSPDGHHGHGTSRTSLAVPGSPTPSHRSASSNRREASLPVPPDYDDHGSFALPPTNMPRRSSRSSSFGSYSDHTATTTKNGLSHAAAPPPPPHPSAAAAASASSATTAQSQQPGTRSSKTLVPASTRGASDRYLVVNRSAGADDSLDNIGSGSLSLDHLMNGPTSNDYSSQNGGNNGSTSNAMSVARAPELLRMNTQPQSSSGADTSASSNDHDDLRTPVPGHSPANTADAYFGVPSSSSTGSTLVLSSSPTNSIHGVSFAEQVANGRSSNTLTIAPEGGRARAASIGANSGSGTQTPIANPSQTSALAGGLPNQSSPAKSIPSYETESSNANAIANRPESRSSSVTSSHDPASLLKPPMTSSPTTSSRQPRRQKSAQGIAGAIALASGVVASPAANLRTTSSASHQGLSLSRTSTRTSFEVGGGGGGNESDGAMSSNYAESHYANFDGLSGHGNDGFDDALNNLGTGYAVASSKRNAEFHSIFKNITDDDYLIEDYGCALQREILIQGRLYISEHHLSFNANIFGWVTTHTLPFAEVVSIEKRMTAYVIPNAIQVTTLHARYTFASFLSRDSTYDLMCNIWRMVHPVVPTSAALPDSATNRNTDTSIQHDSEDDEDLVPGGGDGEKEALSRKKSGKRRLRGLRKRGNTNEEKKADSHLGESIPNSTGGPSPRIGNGVSPPIGSANGNNTTGGGGGATKHALVMHPVTVDTCATLKNLKEICMDTIFPSSPEKIYNLMFTSGFMKTFWSGEQKLLELQIGDWAPEKSGSNLLSRSLSYIKPLNAPIGPKQTKCMIVDETAHVDFDDYVCVITTTRTPDVPSGGSFSVKTRTSMTWAKGNSCRVLITTGVEWTGRSMIKGIIERSCIDGQKTYHADLEKAMRHYIHQHRSEFLEEGQQNTSSSGENDEASASEDEDESLRNGHKGGELNNDLDVNSNSMQRRKSLAESNSNGRVLGTIFDTLSSIIETFTSGDFTSGTSPKSILLGIVIIGLLVSNLWTLSSRSTNKSSSLTSSSRTKSSSPTARNPNDRTPDQVADAVRDVLKDYFASVTSPPLSSSPAVKVLPIEGSIPDVEGEGVLGRRSKEWVKEETVEIRKILDGLQERIDRLKNSLNELD